MKNLCGPRGVDANPEKGGLAALQRVETSAAEPVIYPEISSERD